MGGMPGGSASFCRYSPPLALACVLLLKPLDTRGLGLQAGTEAQIPQFAEQSDSVIVTMGLLGGDERADLAPDLLFWLGKRVKPELARRTTPTENWDM